MTWEIGTRPECKQDGDRHLPLLQGGVGTWPTPWRAPAPCAGAQPHARSAAGSVPEVRHAALPPSGCSPGLHRTAPPARWERWEGAIWPWRPCWARSRHRSRCLRASGQLQRVRCDTTTTKIAVKDLRGSGQAVSCPSEQGCATGPAVAASAPRHSGPRARVRRQRPFGEAPAVAAAATCVWMLPWTTCTAPPHRRGPRG